MRMATTEVWRKFMEIQTDDPKNIWNAVPFWVFNPSPLGAWRKFAVCANLFFVPRCSPSPNRNQPTCLSWGPSVSCAKLEVCPAQIKTTSHLDVRTMAHAENVDGRCQRSFPCKLPLGRQESQCLLYPVPFWRGKAARHEPQPCRFGLRPTQVSLWSVWLVHGRLCTLRYLKLSDLLELPWVFCLFLEEKAEENTRKNRTWNWKGPLRFCCHISSGCSPKNQRLPAPNHQWLWWLCASHGSGSMRLTMVLSVGSGVSLGTGKSLKKATKKSHSQNYPKLSSEDSVAWGNRKPLFYSHDETLHRPALHRRVARRTCHGGSPL